MGSSGELASQPQRRGGPYRHQRLGDGGRHRFQGFHCRRRVPQQGPQVGGTVGVVLHRRLPAHGQRMTEPLGAGLYVGGVGLPVVGFDGAQILTAGHR